MFDRLSRSGGAHHERLVRLLGDEGLGRAAQRAVRDREALAAECQVEHLVDLGDVQRDRERLVARRRCRTRCGRRGTRLLRPRRSSADRRVRGCNRPGQPFGSPSGRSSMNTPPQLEIPPVDVGVLVVEEGHPPGFELGEDPTLVVAVPGIVGRVPGDQMVADAEPRTDLQVRVAGDVDAGQGLEGVDEPLAVTTTEERQQVGDEPRVPRITGGGEVVDCRRIEGPGVDAGDDAVGRLGSGIVRERPQAGDSGGAGYVYRAEAARSPPSVVGSAVVAASPASPSLDDAHALVTRTAARAVPARRRRDMQGA